MNNDIISRSALLEIIDGIYDCNDMVFEGDRDHSCKPEDCKGCHWYDTKQYIRRKVKNAPAVEAVPVRTGRWVMTLYTTTSKRGRVIANKKFACSVCGYQSTRSAVGILLRQSSASPSFRMP